MRKRRRLANKMTIMLCAVLLAVSAFFYAPMNVSAEEFTGNGNAYGSTQSYNNSIQEDFGLVDLYPEAQAGTVYKLEMHIRYQMYFGNDLYWRNIAIRYGNVPLVSVNDPDSGTGTDDLHYVDRTITVYLDSSQINGKSFNTSSRHIAQTDFGVFTFYSRFTYDITSIVSLSATESEQYLLGYQNGYSEGYDNGESSGYSSGFQAGVDSVDTDSIYQEGFQAGIDSVDTDGLYQAGYNSGVQVGYQEGYLVGYDDGYEDAMERISSWGADTSDYPILVYKKNLSDVSCEMEVVTNMPSVGHGLVNLCNLDIDINPSHTYKIVFDSVYPSTSVGNLSGSMNEQFNYNIGLFSIPWSSGESFGFVQGSSLSSVFRLEVYDYSAHYYEIGGENDVFQPWEGYRIFNFDSIDVFVYDMGPSGDTQNHIANQTDQLTNGYDDSKGNQVNSDFSTGLNDYESAENSLFATATTGMRDFTFFDFASVPAMITGMSFIGSIMGSWFEQAGGASGVGIVLSILFSVILVAMVLGLYRWYQSRGGKN